MDATNILGLIAGTITTVSFLPQVIKTLRSRSAHDVSMEMFTFLSIGIFLWVIYGFLSNALPVIIANSVSFILVLAMVILKLKYR